jgi:hypothetical protein
VPGLNSASYFRLPDGIEHTILRGRPGRSGLPACAGDFESVPLLQPIAHSANATQNALIMTPCQNCSSSVYVASPRVAVHDSSSGGRSTTSPYTSNNPRLARSRELVVQVQPVGQRRMSGDATALAHPSATTWRSRLRRQLRTGGLPPE